MIASLFTKMECFYLWDSVGYLAGHFLANKYEFYMIEEIKIYFKKCELFSY